MMEMTKAMKEVKFLFRNEFYEAISKIEDQSVRLALYELIVMFGLTGVNGISKYPIEDHQREKLEFILNPIFDAIDRANKHHERCVENGRRGGQIGGKIAGRGRRKLRQPDNADVH